MIGLNWVLSPSRINVAPIAYASYILVGLMIGPFVVVPYQSFNLLSFIRRTYYYRKKPNEI